MHGGIGGIGSGGSATRRQGAWPAEYQVGAGSGNMGLGAGYGFPAGLVYGQRAGGHDAPGVGVVGGELVF